MRKSLVLCGFIALLFGCSDDTDTSVNAESQSSPQSSCSGGKCDDPNQIEIPELGAISLDKMISCSIERDTSNTDEFFQRDQGTCYFHGLPVDGVGLRKVALDIRAQDGRSINSVYWMGDDLKASNSFKFVVQADDYPLTMSTQVIWTGAGFGLSGDIDAVEDDMFHGGDHGTEQLIERPDETVDAFFAPQLEFWPVVVWPTQELETAWAQDEFVYWLANMEGSLDIPRGPGLTQGSSSTFVFPFETSLIARSATHESLTPLTQIRLLIPAVPGEPSDAVLRTELVTASSDIEVDAAFTQPGYYLFEKDGTIAPATPEQIRERGARPTTAPVVTNPDMGDVSDMLLPDSGSIDSMDMGMPQDDMNTEPDMPVVDPCMDTCSDTQVCVNAQCVTRSQQAQSSCNVNPYKPCDLGEDSDCADGNVCVEGLCRLLSCQEQASCNVTPYRPCEQDSHCADGNSCNDDGLCQKDSCN